MLVSYNMGMSLDNGGGYILATHEKSNVQGNYNLRAGGICCLHTMGGFTLFKSEIMFSLYNLTYSGTESCIVHHFAWSKFG